MLTRRQALLAGSAALTGFAGRASRVHPARAPEGALQPQAVVDEQGVLHLLYFSGDPKNGDVWYVTSRDAGGTYSSPLRVNSQPGSAIALGSIRGAQLALGSGGRPHVAWNGSQMAEPKGPVNPDSGGAGSPMLYSRLNDSGNAFEPQRNLMLTSFGLDGGGSVAADRAGNVYVAWHGIGLSEAKGSLQGEARRQVWLARSTDNGRTFTGEQKAWTRPAGACGCCGMKIFVDSGGGVEVLYRSATESVHRDIYLLHSADHGRSFQGGLIHKWELNACPMSSMDFAANTDQTVCAWETAGQIYWLRLTRGGSPAQPPISAPGDAKGRKHPRIAINSNGEVLLAWTEGTAWQKGGSLGWQVFDAVGRPADDSVRLPGAIAPWSFAAASALPDGRFSLLY